MRWESMAIIRRIIFNDEGQATVELAIMFPVVLIIAVIAVNALTFFSECSSFDRAFKQVTTCIGPNPGYGKNIGNTKSIIESELQNRFDEDFLDFEVSVENVSGGFQEFRAVLKMYPTLFGMGLRSEIFGVPLPSLNHEQKMVIEVYKPGVIF